MRDWLRQTHGPLFELLRHFLLRFFDSDIVTTPGQMTLVLAGAFPMCFQWFFLLIGPLRSKYDQLSKFPDPGPYFAAVRADELWLLTLMMGVIGLLTAAKWQSLFPDLRDYRALATLPLRAWQIFGAKLAALLLIATVALVTINMLPTFGFPPLSTGRWAPPSSIGPRTLAHGLASVAACAFVLFSMVALQGVLLNVLRPRAFGRIAGYLQGGLVALMLSLAILSFSIQPQIANTLIQPAWAAWLPPIWFLGWEQVLAGNRDLWMVHLAATAQAGLWIAIGLALLTYLISYRRHQTLLVEGPAGSKRHHSGTGKLLAWLVPDPRQQAVLSFFWLTLSRSSHHRMILMGYGGLGLAALMTALLSLGHVAGSGVSVFSMADVTIAQDRVAAAGFIYGHLIGLVVFILGARHIFAIPTELKANWIFQVTEGEGRDAWLDAVDRFLLFWGAVLLYLMPLPLELRLMGWRGLAEPVLLVLISLLVYEWTFASTDKLPFTCSHLPGKTPVWIRAMQFFAVVCAAPVMHFVLLTVLFNGVAYVIAVVAMMAACRYARAMRRSFRIDLQLKYVEVPAPAVNSLDLLK